MNKPLIIFAAFMIFMMGFWVPEARINPVVGLQFSDKPAERVSQDNGVNIFTNRNAPVVSATNGLVVYKRQLGNGTQAVTILGPKWRLHHYTYLKQVALNPLQMVKAGQKIGLVATVSSNRKRSGYVNYAIQSLSPELSQLDTRVPEGWKRIFYVNPRKFLTQDGNEH